MNYEIVIVGHGRYPDGVLSALQLLIGTTEGIKAFNLDEQTTHEKFEKQLTELLSEHERVLVFADMTGGAPHQIVSRLVLEGNRPHQYVISSAPLNLMLDLYAKSLTGFEDDTIEGELQHTLTLSKQLIEILPDRMNTNSATAPVPDMTHQYEGDGI